LLVHLLQFREGSSCLITPARHGIGKTQIQLNIGVCRSRDDTDGNPRTVGDPSFVPFITTPCFPSYPSNHGSAANGAAEILKRIYGEGGHSITLSNPAVPDIVLQYTTFKQITDDISDARVYGGIHFRTDQVAGERLGKAVGKAVYRNNLRRMHDYD
jgi:hypothetical protein